MQMDTELLSDTFVDLADTMVADFDRLPAPTTTPATRH
jgi:hypothetical protein